MARWYRLFTQILSCLALTLLSITVVTPHWIWVIGPHLNFTMGLWSICANNHCTHLVVDSVMFRVFRVLMLTTVVIGMMAVATSFVSSFRRYQLPVITNVSAGLLPLIFMLIYHLWICNSLLLDGLGFPLFAFVSWSFPVECLGCLMFMICGLLHVLLEVEKASRIHPKSILKENIASNVALKERKGDAERSGNVEQYR